MRRGPAGAPERRRADREPRPEEHPDGTQGGAEAPAPGRRPPAQDGGGPAARSRGPEKPKSAQQKLFCLKLVLNKTPFLCGFGREAGRDFRRAARIALGGSLSITVCPSGGDVCPCLGTSTGDLLALLRPSSFLIYT